MFRQRMCESPPLTIPVQPKDFVTALRDRGLVRLTYQNGGPKASPLLSAQFKYGAELGTPGDEYNKSPCREGSPRLLNYKSHLPSLLHEDL